MSGDRIWTLQPDHHLDEIVWLCRGDREVIELDAADVIELAALLTASPVSAPAPETPGEWQCVAERGPICSADDPWHGSLWGCGRRPAPSPTADQTDGAS